MTIQEIRTAIEAQQMIQQRNPPTSAKWREASDNLRVLGAMLNRMLDEAKTKEIN